MAALEHVQNQGNDIRDMAQLLKTSPDRLKNRLELFLQEHKQRERELETLKSRLLTGQTGDLLSGVKDMNGVKTLVREIKADSPKALREYADRVKEKLDSGVIVLGTKEKGKVMLISVVTEDLTNRFKAGEIIRKLSEIVGGKGGGRPDMAQGGGNKPEKLGSALETAYEIIQAF
jgi:alanyl-tRNA synthetase